MVAPEKKCWWAIAAKGLRVSGVREFLRITPKKVIDIMKVPIVHRNLGADGGLK